MKSNKWMWVAVFTHLYTLLGWIFIVLFLWSTTLFSLSIIIYCVVFISAIPTQLVWAKKQQKEVTLIKTDIVRELIADKNNIYLTDEEFMIKHKKLVDKKVGAKIGKLNYWLIQKYTSSIFIFFSVAFCWTFVVPIVLGIIWGSCIATDPLKDIRTKLLNDLASRHQADRYIELVKKGE